MANNVSVLEIKIKAHLIVGKSIEEAHDALTLAREAQETNNYAALLESANILDVTVEQKTRRYVDVDE